MAFRRRGKFNATRVEYDGIKFDSKKEKERYIFLRELEESGEISDLIVHPKYALVMPDGTDLIIKGRVRNNKCSYKPDFTYSKDGVLVIEDVKSRPTADEYSFKLKRSIFEAFYKINVNLVFNVKLPAGEGER